MSKLTPNEIKRQLQDRLNTLHSEAIANRSNFQLGKASGIGSLIFGGIGCAAFPPLGIPAAVVAGGLWLASVFAETTTTGRIMPLPWVGVRLLDLAAGMDRMATTAGMEADEVELTDYLSPELRTEYLLIRFQGEQLSTALSQLDEYEVETGFATIVARAMKVFGGGGMRLNEATEESAEFVGDAAASLSLSLPRIEPRIASRIDPQGSPILEALEDYRVAQIQRSAQAAALLGSVDVESRSIPAIAELTVGEFIDTTPQGRLTDSSEAIAIEILDGLVASRRSTLLIGGTGSGKSVTQSYLLVNLLKRCPDGEVFVISQKADAFAGLSSVGQVVLFDQFNPGEALSTIDRVWAEYDRRRKLPEQNRSGLPPVRLLLCDWLSINAALEACAKDPEIKESRYLSKLIDIIYNGRELNVCLWVDLQSFNLAAIGMKADSNSRKNFNVIGLGNYYVDEAGGINESYGVLSNMIQNKYFVDNDVEREKLMREFNRLKGISKANQRPVMFTTLEPARVALAADIRAYKTMQVVQAQPTRQTQPTKPADDPWQEYEVYTKEMNLESLPPNPKIDKLISDLRNNSRDARSPSFINWLETLRTGQSIDETGIDPQFVQIAKNRKIINQQGVIV